MATHLAAVTPAKGQPFELRTRPTPKPGPDELLIEVKSVALNPADYIMRDQGLFIPTYPTVIGFDLSGLVLEVGDNVPTNAVDEDMGPMFEPGITRVAAYAASHWKSWDADYGAFQERCLVPWQHAVPLPDGHITWNQAATLPVGFQVALSAWDVLGIPRVGRAHESDNICAGQDGEKDSAKPWQVKQQQRNVLLIWGASSSVGSAGVQSARLLRGDHHSSIAAVYATAGAANHDYVRSLGANRVFDYKDPQVVQAIIAAAREDGLAIRHCFLAMGQIAPCQAVLEAFRSDLEGGGDQVAKIGSAPPIPPDVEEVNGMELSFLMPSMDKAERLAQFRYWMGSWLREHLADGAIRPSPKLRFVGSGLEAVNAGLDALRKGVTCTKLVVEIAE